MTVLNVHRRAVAASADEVGRLIDTLAAPGDRLWPHERWPAMRFDRPGITPGGLLGHHQFLVQGTGPTSSVLWHLTDLEPRFPMTVTWRLFWRPLHDALIEDALAKAQALGEGPGAPTPTWSSYVRLLRRATAPLVGRARPRAVVTRLET